MTEKKGKATLEQAASMMVVVSHSSFREILLTFFKCYELADHLFFVHRRA